MLAGCAPAGACAEAEPGGLCLATASRTQVRFGASAAVAADVDGDGALDLVTADGGAVSVVWAAGSGEFATATTWSVAREVAGVAVADLDGDGRLDVATALPGEDAVAVLHGRGGRALASPRRVAAGSGPRAVIAAPLAGAPALVTANADGTVTVLGADGPATTVAVGAGPQGLTGADVDGDGRLDVVVALADEDALQVLLGDGAGGLRAGPRHPVGAAPGAVVAADLDGDGKTDVAAAEALGDGVSVLWGDGTGGVRARIGLATAAQPEALVLLSEGTGPPVLGVMSRATSTVQRLDPRDGTLRATATAAWATAVAPGPDGTLLYVGAGGEVATLLPGEGLRLATRWVGPAAAKVWPVDLDGDGVDELLVAGDGGLALWRSGAATRVAVEATAGDGAEARAGEVTGDGRVDVVLFDGRDLVVLVQEDGGLRAGPAAAGAVDVVVADGDGDGVAEVWAARADGARLEVAAADADGALRAVRSMPLASRARALRAVDERGDGRAEVLIRGDEAWWIVRDGADAPAALAVPGAAHAVFADFDGDAEVDAVSCDEAGLRHWAHALAADAAPVWIGPGGCDGLAAADLDGDAMPDLLVSRRSVVLPSEASRLRLTPVLRRGGVWAEAGSAVVADRAAATLARLAAGAPPGVVVADAGGVVAHDAAIGPGLIEAPPARFGTGPVRFGDVDGDGAADLVSGLAVALADGAGGFGPLRRTSEAQLGRGTRGIDDLVTLDADGDGVDELVVAWPGPDGVVVAAAAVVDGAVAVGSRLATSPGRVFLRAGDVDGDGRVEAVALRVGDSLGVRVLAGAEAAWTEAASPTPVGTPQLFDVDRDGRLDVVAAGEAGVLVFRGTAGGFADATIWAAASGAAPLPGDFDSDGTVDLAARQDGRLLLRRGAGWRTLLAEATAATAADLDGDGALELLAAARAAYAPVGAGVLHVGRGVGGVFTFTGHALPVEPPLQVQAVDADGDGDLDVAVVDASGVTIVRQGP
jgi:hypothetical protein